MCCITGGITGGDGGAGPVRVGIFATSTTNTRAAAGASYWGVLNLSDNLGEYYYRHLAGQSSRSPGSGIPWGDGNLTNPGGEANTPNWVITCNTTDVIVRGVTNSALSQPYAAISGRGGVSALWTGLGDCVGRYQYIGGRGGR